MKSDCSTRTVYLITSFDESNSFKLKTKKNGQQFFWSFNCALIRPSQRPVARKPTSDCQTHWTILCSELWIIFFFVFVFSLGADLFSSLVYTVAFPFLLLLLLSLVLLLLSTWLFLMHSEEAAPFSQTLTNENDNQMPNMAVGQSARRWPGVIIRPKNKNKNGFSF
jgi:hypothetical protein